eukprot:3208405-Rhodomonas_salina.4
MSKLILSMYINIWAVGAVAYPRGTRDFYSGTRGTQYQGRTLSRCRNSYPGTLVKSTGYPVPE